MQHLRSLIFIILMYVVMTVMGIVFFPLALASRTGARWTCKTFCRWVIWSARVLVGLRCEVRGHVPADEVMVAAKHQSFLDIIMIFNALPRAKFIMKRELLWAPFVGQYAWRIGCIPVERGKRGAAIKKMVADVAAGHRNPGQLVIYPQGTRVAPSKYLPYKVGSHVLYTELGQPCVPVAANVGVFWPKRGILRKPGVAVVDFLDPMQPGLSRAEFLGDLEKQIESRSIALMQEAGFENFPEEAKPYLSQA